MIKASMTQVADERRRPGPDAEPSGPGDRDRPLPGGFYVALADLGADMDDGDRLRRRAMGSLQAISRRLKEGSQSTARRHGIHVTDRYVLMILYHANPEHLGRAAVIQRALGFTAGGITRRMDAMIAKGLALRLPDPNDGRALLLQLTEKGVSLAKDIHADPSTRGFVRTRNLSPAEWQLLSDLLDRIDAPHDSPE
jgi:DNA-binding MarR family transcriptional regulator